MFGVVIAPNPNLKPWLH